jgi:uncharacterized membrane protein
MVEEVGASGSDETGDGIAKGLFGFRSKKPWKMVVASLYYFLAVAVGIAVMTSRKPYAHNGTDIALEVLSGVLLTIALLSPALLLSDFGYRHRLPLFKRRKVALSALGLVLFFGLMVVASAIADTLHTAPYKVAAAKEAAQQAAAANAKRAADEERRAAADEQKTAEAEAKKLADDKEAQEARARAEAARVAEQKKAEEAKRLAEQKPADAASKSGASIALVAPSLGGKFGITSDDLREKRNPKGSGTFVYAPQTSYSDSGYSFERQVVWLVLDGYAYPLNGATKDVTPELKWPREADETTWEKSGLNPYSPTEALEIVFGAQ